MRNILALPTILVARGCLAPYFLEWWRKQLAPLHVLDFSRWRWFEFGSAALPRWIGPAPSSQNPVVLFDRNTTTGQTLRLLRKWLHGQGFTEVLVMGHMDRKMGRFGLNFADFVWNDGEGYDRLGLACSQNGGGVRIVPASEYRVSLGGAYTVCIIGGHRSELGGIEAPAGATNLRSDPAPVSGSVVFQNVPDWEQAMVLGYVNQKPLITVAGREGVIADYGFGENLSDLTDYLKEESL